MQNKVVTNLEWPDLSGVDIIFNTMRPTILKLVTILILKRNANAIGEFNIRDMKSRGIVHYDLVVRKQHNVHG